MADNGFHNQLGFPCIGARIERFQSIPLEDWARKALVAEEGPRAAERQPSGDPEDGRYTEKTNGTRPLPPVSPGTLGTGLKILISIVALVGVVVIGKALVSVTDEPPRKAPPISTTSPPSPSGSSLAGSRPEQGNTAGAPAQRSVKSQLRPSLREMKGSITERKDRIKSLESELRRIESELSYLDNKIHSLNSSISQLENSGGNARLLIAEHNRLVKVYNQTLSVYKSSHAKYTQLIDETNVMIREYNSRTK